LLIRIRLRLPSLNEHGLPTLHGVHGTLSFTRPWATTASCVTDVYAANVHQSRDIAPLQSQTLGHCVGDYVASLPESDLSRCRWLDSTKQTSIYQRIIVDDNTMAVIIYDLDRSVCDNAPFAEVTGFQKYRVNTEKTYTASLSPVPTPPAYPIQRFAPQNQHVPHSRYPEQMSISSALTPAVNAHPPKNPHQSIANPSSSMYF